MSTWKVKRAARLRLEADEVERRGDTFKAEYLRRMAAQVEAGLKGVFAAPEPRETIEKSETRQKEELNLKRQASKTERPEQVDSQAKDPAPIGVLLASIKLRWLMLPSPLRWIAGCAAAFWLVATVLPPSWAPFPGRFRSLGAGGAAVMDTWTGRVYIPGEDGKAELLLSP